MPSRTRAGVLFGSVLFVLGCKESSDAARPLPAPEPPATAVLTPPREDTAAPKKRPAVDEDDAPVRPKSPSVVVTPPVATGGTAGTDAPVEPPTTASGGTATTPTAVPSIPPLTAPSAACLSRCQGALQGCLSQPVDGGVPGFGNLDICKQAFTACQSSCK